MAAAALTPYRSRPRRPFLDTLASPFVTAGRVLASGLKAAALVFARGAPSWGGAWGASWGVGWRSTAAFNYADAVGDGLSSSILVACLNAIASVFPEPPARVYRPDEEGTLQPVPAHPLPRLLKRPNPYMTWELLGRWIVYCQHVTGNAYFYKVRSGARRVVQLWPLLPSHVAPRWPDDSSNTVWISHYEYTPNGTPIRLPVEDVLHLPLDIDPDNPRQGRSPLKALFQELFTDQEAAAFTAALLKNMGVPGVILTPDPSAQGGPTREDAQRYKTEFAQKFGGDHRGEPLVLGGAMKVSVLSFSPEQLNLDKLRTLPETRVSGVLGVPAIVAHLKAGLERATYSNARQLVEFFVESKMVPYWRQIAGQLTLSLLPEFSSNEDEEVQFDLSDVRALQEDQDALYKRLSEGVKAGWIRPEVAQAEAGLPVDPALKDVYYVPTSIKVVPAAQLTEPPPAPPALPLPAQRITVTEVPPGEEEVETEEAAEKARTGAETKATDPNESFQRALLRQRDRQAGRLEGEVAAYFRGLASRVVGRYRAEAGKTLAMASSNGVSGTLHTKAEDDGDEAVSVDVDALIPASEEAGLTTLLRGAAQTVGEATFDLVSDRLGVGIAFDLANPLVGRYLSRAGEHVKGILDTTRTELRDALRAGEAEGEGIPQLAKRVRAVVEESYKGQAENIARTETATAQIRASMAAYELSGVVVGILFLDQESDPPCEGWNGRKMSLEEAADVPELIHPRCTQARAPLLAGEL